MTPETKITLYKRHCRTCNTTERRRLKNTNNTVMILRDIVESAGIDLGRALAILTLLFRKWRSEKTVGGQFGA